MNLKDKKKINEAAEAKPVPVQIRPIQVPHFQRIMDILKREYAYLDVSPFGAGKTHITYAVAATFKLNMIVICPKTAISNWKNWAQKYGINIICILSYESLRGQSGKVNHGLLECVEDGYHATELFEQCVKAGLLLVFDEYHRVKNDNTQLASSHALVKSVVRLVRMGYKARIALLSATPCQSKESVTSTFKMLGIILSDKLYKCKGKKYELVGIQEAIAKCNEYDADETLAITCRAVNRTTAKTICHDLYVRVLKKYVVTSMPPPDIEVEKDCKNYYILMPDEDVQRLKNGLLLFKSATNYNEDIKEVNYSGTNWGDVTKSRMEIDSAKIFSTCRVAKDQLNQDPMCKILIYCNYTRDIERARQLLAEYNPLVLNGSVNNTSERQRIISAFQEGSNKHRVFISIPSVGGMGIDLDDKVGDRPRYMYILPSYFFTDQYQTTGRIWRDGTMSKATIRFIYSRAFPYESGILDSMANKSKIVRTMVTTEHDTLKFPGEYDEILELTPEEKETQNNQEQNGQN